MGVGLTRCGDCGELHGGSCLCLCEGLVCGACGQGRIHRPISARCDEVTREIINVPYFMGLMRCRICGAQSRWEAARDHDA